MVLRFGCVLGTRWAVTTVMLHLIPRGSDLIGLGCTLVIRIPKISSDDTNVPSRWRATLKVCQTLTHRHFLRDDWNGAKAYLFLRNIAGVCVVYI